VAAFGLSAILASGFSVGDAGAETTLEGLKGGTVLRIGYANEPPFAFLKDDGTVTGESPEIVKQVMTQMGVTKVEAVLTEWASLIPGLRAKRFDIIAAGMFVLPKRCKQILFTDPHYKLGSAFLVKKGNPKKLHSYADIAENQDSKIAVLAGAVEQDYARGAGIPDDRMLLTPDAAAQIQAVISGRADAAAQTALAIQAMADKGGDEVERASPFVNKPEHLGYGGLGFRKEDKALRDAVNTAVQAWLGTPGHLKTIGQFGFTEAELPGGKSAADLCAGG
jgi:polar amino acid transport system substrate-binding protein